MTNSTNSSSNKELFSRNKRRHPIWKSEAEYKAIFERQLGEEKLNLLEYKYDMVEEISDKYVRVYIKPYYEKYNSFI